MGKRQRILQGCGNCQMCTGHAFTGVGRSVGRASADIATLGISHLARRTCKACAHPMTEHATAQVQVVQQPQAVYMQAPQPVAPQPIRPAGWYPDPTDPRAQCWFDGFQWVPASKRY